MVGDLLQRFAFSDSTGSSMNISLNGSSSFASTFAIGRCTRPWKSTPMPMSGPTASRIACDAREDGVDLLVRVDELHLLGGRSSSPP